MTDRDGYEYEIKYSGTMDRQGLCPCLCSYIGASTLKSCMAVAPRAMPRHPPRHEPRQPYRRRVEVDALACEGDQEGWLF